MNPLLVSLIIVIALASGITIAACLARILSPEQRSKREKEAATIALIMRDGYRLGSLGWVLNGQRVSTNIVLYDSIEVFMVNMLYAEFGRKITEIQALGDYLKELETTGDEESNEWSAQREYIIECRLTQLGNDVDRIISALPPTLRYRPEPDYETGPD